MNKSRPALLLLCLLPIYTFALKGFNENQTKAIEQYIKNTAKTYQLDETALKRSFEVVELKEDILHSISHTSENTLPWYRYRNIFLKQPRIDQGVAFWKTNQKALALAEKQYGVPPEIIVAILGVETLYGQRQGNYRVLDALTTLGFAYPPRAKFFRKELTEFLLLSKEQQFQPHQILGSYAGAIGKPQFIPSSYRNYATDLEKTGKSDIINSDADAIASIANYLHKNGWEKHVPILHDAKLISSKRPNIKQNNNKPQYTLSSLQKYGVVPKEKLNTRKKFVFLELPTDENHLGYWLGTHNFYVITRYNTSKLYAMAAAQLAEAIKKGFNKKV